MKAFMTNTKTELYKLLCKKKYTVLTVLGALIGLLVLGSYALVAHLSNGEIQVKANLMMSMLRFVTDILVPLVVFMAVTDLFASEVQEDTFKAALTRPATRFKVMSAKAFAAFLIGCFSALSVFVLSCIFQLLFTGGGLNNIPFALASYLIDMIPVTALVSMALLINMLAKTPTFSLLMCIAVYVVFKCLNLYVSPIGQMIFTAYSGWHKIWLGTLQPFGSMLPKICILFGSVLILYSLSYIIFDREDY